MNLFLLFLDIDECNSKICTNGLCHNTAGSFSCVCNIGYTGKGCDVLLEMLTNDSEGSSSTLSTPLVSYIVISVASFTFMLGVIMLLYSRHLQHKYRKSKEDPEDVDEIQLDSEHTGNVLNSDVKHHTSGITCNAIGLNTIVPNSQALATSCQSLPRSAGPCNDMTDNQAYGIVTTPARIAYEDVQPHLPTTVVPDSSDAHSMTNNNAYGIPQFREIPQRDD